MPDPESVQPTEPDLVYGRAPASGFLAFLGPLRGTVVDIGSGEGGWADLLRRAGASRLVAVEPDPATATVARARYDLVIEKPIEEVDPAEISAADVIVAADCLEHMIDPWAALRHLSTAAGPHARLAVSVPNLRYLGILGPAALRGRFEYTDGGGLMDRGHLRWFTRASMCRSLSACGWVPERWSGATGSGKRAALDRLTGRVFGDLLAHQVYVLAARQARA